VEIKIKAENLFEIKEGEDKDSKNKKDGGKVGRYRDQKVTERVLR
jgi:hypothetical protein